MSRNESAESNDTFRTPLADPEDGACEELDPAPPEPDIGASPVLSGPVTRSGKKEEELSACQVLGKEKQPK